jgi:hypothetical protein
LRDLRAMNIVLKLPWLDDEQASLQYGTARVFTMMDGTIVETETKEHRLECRLMAPTKVQRLMRKTRRDNGRKADFFVSNITPATLQPSDRRYNNFHT